MTKRRNVLLAVFIAVAGMLAVGAWEQKPGEDSDNQGGVAFALLGLLVVLCIAVVKITRAVSARLVPQKNGERLTPTRGANWRRRALR